MHKLGGSDLRGMVLLSTCFVRFPADLSGSPALPASLTDHLAKSWSWRGHYELPTRVAAKCREWLRQTVCKTWAAA